jgi:EAL domain-containing protein (putative c-di-GMP-specific phosphodiesterase class I)
MKESEESQKITSSLTVDQEFSKLLRTFSNEACGTCFVIKITNYELLSLILTTDKLSRLFLELEQLVISTVTQAGHPINHDAVMSKNFYLACVTKKVNSLSISHLAYLIYHNIQLHISSICPDISLECKISTINLSQDFDININKLKNLLCQLVIDKRDRYYLELYDKTIEDMQSNTEKLNLFKKSLSGGTFSFAYQQIIESQTGDIPYYECLLRIPDKDGTLISAGPFIGLAETAGLNNVLDQVVLNMVVDELRAAPAYVSISVNISNAGVLDCHLLNTARSLLANNIDIARRLIIEITETSLNIDFEQTQIFCDIMSGFGCKIALDDFGTGYTSFKQLQKLRVDVIKIDGSFIRGIIDNKRDQDLVYSLIEIAHNLGAKTVAEYVENGEIAKFLIDAGIDYMQGHFFSPAVNYRAWIRS